MKTTLYRIVVESAAGFLVVFLIYVAIH